MKVKFLITFVLLFFTLLGCSSSAEPGENASKLITSYKQAQYQIEPVTITTSNRQQVADEINEKVKPYLTDHTHQLFVNNRDAYTAVHSAEKSYTVLVESVVIDQIEKDTDKFQVSYTMTLTYTSYDKKETKSETVKCQADIVNENGDWKISRDWESRHPEILNSL
ncbi:hypothetical protein NDK47_24700 [Brevibacillus ruminantium]|uniref:Lipoprotein n=1 Tax=Brevibacillus ruminantium TaxID=2950604 RepID=A0ABY4WDK4_9BACL|nr:hypothetical protein [Brevibacillus ruminantium]USG65270.1 hypothetical protein NDK47_24700 [Brevibacillus ruminantium]